MDLNSIINSPGLWIASSFMVLAVLGQSILFFRAAWKESSAVGLTKEQCVRGMRSAMITAIGPSLSLVIILVSLIAVLGGPTAWMRMNDIGAGRTELGMSSIAAGLVGSELQVGKITIEGFSAAIWGMALNNMAWMLVALLLTHRMSKAVSVLNEKYDPAWIKMMMASAAIGLFGYLLCNQLVGKASPFLIAALASAGTMLTISRVLKKYPRLQEVALGVSMLVGMFVAAAIA
jgi:hypothetical protein